MKHPKKHQYTLAKLNPLIMSQIMGYQRCINLAKNDLYNRAYGAIFGFVIRDAQEHILPICPSHRNKSIKLCL
jgi:hypothetical protein